MELLAVDGDAQTLRQIGSIFASAGMPVCTSTTLRAAKAMLSQSSLIVLVTEAQLPDGSGAELVRAARQLRPWFPVVYLTREPSFAAPPDAAAEIVRKPFTQEQIALAVGNAIAAASTRRPWICV